MRPALLASFFEAFHAIVWNAGDPLRDRVRYHVTDGGGGADARPWLRRGDVAAPVVVRGGALHWPATDVAAQSPYPQSDSGGGEVGTALPPLHVRLRLGGACGGGEREVLAPPPATAGRGGITVEHEATVRARRRAVAGMLAAAFGLDAGSVRRELEAAGGEWAAVARASAPWRRGLGAGGSVGDEALVVDVVVS